ncbi:MAG: hypothetical protein R3200_15445, partial [Xanthomonadales bacterium]|nr:hypothetical protein [Xanthomonadales bacterium]
AAALPFAALPFFAFIAAALPFAALPFFAFVAAALAFAALAFFTLVAAGQHVARVHVTKVERILGRCCGTEGESGNKSRADCNRQGLHTDVL